MKDGDLIPVSVKEISPNGLGNLSLKFIPAAGKILPGYSAGAHIDIMIPGIGPRQYSLCGIPDHRQSYEVCVKLDDISSGGSRYLHHELQPGDRLSISRPRNHFPLPAAGRYLLLAGGIGITPLLAMAEEIARQQIDFEIHYYVATALHAAFTARLEQLSAAGNVVIHCSDEGDSLRRRIPACLTVSEADTAVIACGPDGFIQRLQDLMPIYNWQATQFFFERFTPVGLNNEAENKSFYIELASTGQRLPVAPEQTIAQVLLHARVEVMLSCEQGICGSCITDVIDGIPEHRDCVLTAEEKASNSQITLCCSRSKTPVLVLDL
ncbi:vanillate O-demethylase ferredoxin subunit [Raoultella sp. BIGb0138]|uniref:PDR/VanB family oxidoreductase n=1 Tax=Raoultella sp. BIGb0138 TaxID=2485115 RepID=UPI0010487A8B|nr:PDR/VanB family oxidoreductase [Raoultella sp. BIGb0138]TCW17373.1 vanillate O-demethylase ferredoxin subunit [Raoultella sp. BIGb0138]